MPKDYEFNPDMMVPMRVSASIPRDAPLEERFKFTSDEDIERMMAQGH